MMTESKLTNTPATKLAAIAAQPLQGKNILAVEDDESILALITIILERAGATVTAVGGADAALLALQANPHYDLLLSDLAMPDTDGWSLIRQVRALAAESGGKILAAALTAYNTKKDRDISLFYGFQILLSKPIEPAMLVADVVKLLRNHHPQQV
ncbi:MULTISPECIES: response regulator [unclassified Chamaesiphon]|uniref:response regulator n=1 Tax=unclassified Chamaesiphon TaxID=2620921 RepID=UPI00286D28DB|nr:MULTISPECIES: response regulator [unclassified Chamaesiphon]